VRLRRTTNRLIVAPGNLDWQPAVDRTDLLADPVAGFLAGWEDAADVSVAAIDPELADTAAFCERYAVPLAVSANCVVVAGRRGDDVRYAACMILATDRADVNGVVRRRLDARKASFAPMDDAVTITGMEYGGITPLGLPADWPILVDDAILNLESAVIGSGVRRSKIALPGPLLAQLPQAEVMTLRM
jgi:prolyl-tRNA editing enzyme YbaK/EbsC (Cys-tRNA(Pro) deacylase)